MSDVIALHFFWVEKIESFQMRKAVGLAQTALVCLSRDVEHRKVRNGMISFGFVRPFPIVHSLLSVSQGRHLLAQLGLLQQLTAVFYDRCSPPLSGPRWPPPSLPVVASPPLAPSSVAPTTTPRVLAPTSLSTL